MVYITLDAEALQQTKSAYWYYNIHSKTPFLFQKYEYFKVSVKKNGK